MNNKLIFVMEAMQDEANVEYVLNFEDDLELEWRVSINASMGKNCQVTFRGTGVNTNTAYSFVNNLIFNNNVNSLDDIKEIQIIQNGQTYVLPKNKINRIDTTNSIMGAEVVLVLRNIESTDQVPFNNLPEE